MGKGKERTLSGFGDVADNINIDSNSKSDTDILGDIMKGKKTKDETHVFRGYYLENEIANTIDRITASKPRGTKSEIVNEVLKKYFKQEGIM